MPSLVMASCVEPVARRMERARPPAGVRSRRGHCVADASVSISGDEIGTLIIGLVEAGATPDHPEKPAGRRAAPDAAGREDADRLLREPDRIDWHRLGSDRAGTSGCAPDERTH